MRGLAQNVQVLLLCWVIWMWNQGTRLALPALGPFIREKFSLSIFQTASYVVAPMLSFYGSMLLVGPLIVRLGYKRSILISSIGAALFLTLAGLLSNPILFFILLILLGFTLSFYIPAAIPWVTSMFPSGKRGFIVGIHESAAPTGQTLGPIIVVLLVSSFGLEYAFLIWSSLVLLTGLAISLVASPTNPLVEQAKVDAKLMSRKRIFIIIIVTTGLLIGNLGIIQIIPLYLVDVAGLDKAFAGVIVGVSRIMGLIGQPLAGVLSDKYGRVPMIIILTILTFISTAYIAYAPYNIIYILFLILQATCTAMYFTVIYALLSEEAGAYASIQISKILFISGLSGPVLTGFVMGYLAETLGYTIALTYPLLFTILSMVSAPLLRKT